MEKCSLTSQSILTTQFITSTFGNTVMFRCHQESSQPHQGKNRTKRVCIFQNQRISTSVIISPSRAVGKWYRVVLCLTFCKMLQGMIRCHSMLSVFFEQIIKFATYEPFNFIYHCRLLYMSSGLLLRLFENINKTTSQLAKDIHPTHYYRFTIYTTIQAYVLSLSLSLSLSFSLSAHRDT